MAPSICPEASVSWPFSLLALAALLVLATPVAARLGGDDFLLPEQAFKASARIADARSVELSFEVAPGYYLYREQFRFEAPGVTLGSAVVPTGQVKFDETFQKNVETHRGLVQIALPVQQAPGPFTLTVTYQGCADKGLCYPPQQWQAKVQLAAFGGVASLQPLTDAGDAVAATPAATAAPARDADARPVWAWAVAAAVLVAIVGGATLLFRRRTRPT